MDAITTDRCYLNPLDTSDYDDVLSLYSDPEVRKYLGGVVFSEGFHEKFSAMLEDKTSKQWLVRLVSDNSFVGLLSIDMHHDGYLYELSYQIAKHAQGKGLAFEASEAVLSFAFGSMRLDKVLAETQVANKPSIKLLKKLGFQLEREVERFGEQQAIFHLER